MSIQIITETFEDNPILIRASDGYWNLTLMCQACNKRINDYLRLKSTDEYLLELAFDLNQEFVENPVTTQNLYVASVTGKPAAKVDLLFANATKLKMLVEVTQGGKAEQGSWGHELVALDLAAWLKPRFRLWVYKVTRRLLTEGKVYLEEENESLRLALVDKEEKISNLAVENALLEHRYNQSLYRLDSAGLLEAVPENDSPYLYDWEADLQGEDE